MSQQIPNWNKLGSRFVTCIHSPSSCVYHLPLRSLGYMPFCITKSIRRYADTSALLIWWVPSTSGYMESWYTWRGGGVTGSTMTQTFQHFPSGVRKCTSDPHDNPEIYIAFILNSTRNLHLHQHAYLQLGKLNIFVARWGTKQNPRFCALLWLT